ncbi:indigoidine synthase A-like protein [Cyathus striatus]|nr:indigoidine synthase A-like protein [Cyathus striatus]
MLSLKGRIRPQAALRTLSTQSSSLLGAALKKHAPIDVHPEVQHALATNKPLVALETAIVTHGMPYPTNLELTLELENIIRSAGAIPATVGFIAGRAKIGLEKSELERLADKQLKPSKVSRRDIGAVISSKADGGTTCSTTLILAELAGIKVFSTGGLGGVHRGGENTMDVSADLHELSRCSVGLVSSGVKSILDIGKTLEYLETLGVPVISYGTSKEFPAFFSRHSGFEAPWNINNPVAAAEILYSQWQLGMQNGALIAVPIPEQYEAHGESIQRCIDQAIAESEANGVSRRGKEATPWLLSRINELSKGESLAANIALIKNTALVGAQISVQYNTLANLNKSDIAPTSDSSDLHMPPLSTSNISSYTKQPYPTFADVVIVGSGAVDITAQAKPDTNPALAQHSTAPGTVSLSLGGVSRNVAEACHRIMTSHFPSLSSVLVAPIGDDPFGHLFTAETAKIGMRTDGFIISSGKTGVCNMVLDGDGSLIGGVADMEIASSFAPDMIIPEIKKNRPRIVALDGNLSPGTIASIFQYCSQNNIQTFFEPTSIIKSTSVLPAIAMLIDAGGAKHTSITHFAPNLLELAHVYQAVRSDNYDLMSHRTWWGVIDNLQLGSAFRMDLEQLAKVNAYNEGSSNGTLGFLIEEGIAQMAVNLLPFFRNIFVKCGDRGVLVVMHIPAEEAVLSGWFGERSNPRKRYVIAKGKSNELVVVQHFPSLPVDKIANVTGAGDSFAGALLANFAHDSKTLYGPKSLESVIASAQMAAILSLGSHHAVSPLLSKIAL